MSARRGLAGLAFCACFLAAHLTNKYVLSVLKFTCPTLFQGYNVLAWLPASVLFVGIIYAGSRALSRLAIPMFLTLHNAAEVIVCGHGMCFRKEKTPPAKICSALLLLAAAGSLPFNDAQFDPDGYFWAVIHLLCVGAYKILQKSPKPGALSDIDQQYLNYIFSVALLASAAHPTGDLLCARDFPLLYFYRFHSSCCASGLLGFLLTLSALKLKSLAAPGQCAAWLLLAQEAVTAVRKQEVHGRRRRAACLPLASSAWGLLFAPSARERSSGRRGDHSWLLGAAVRGHPDQGSCGMPPARWTGQDRAGFRREEGHPEVTR